VLSRDNYHPVYRDLAARTLRSLLGPALMAHSLCQMQEERMMRELEIQIGNPGLEGE
jgi:hypothetical protein